MTTLWEEEAGALKATFTFKNFRDALIFVNRVAEIAEIEQHHPDIHLHDYKKVTVSTTTHSEGSMVTDKDRRLAKEISSRFEEAA